MVAQHPSGGGLLCALAFLLFFVRDEPRLEHPFPTAADDSRDAFRWIAATGSALGLNIENIGIGGDSAGANIAAATTLQLRDGDGQNAPGRCRSIRL